MGVKNLKRYQVYLSYEEAAVFEKAVKESSLTISSYIRYTIVSNLRRRGYFAGTDNGPELGNNSIS